MAAVSVLRFAIAGTLLIVAGCQEDLTEVVVGIQSDLTPFTELDAIFIDCRPGNASPPLFRDCLGSNMVDSSFRFPMSAGFASTENGPASFSITVQFHKFGLIVVRRNVTGIQFVRQQTLMLVLPMMRACACQGTTCPNPGANPDCDELVDPPLVPLDPVLAPRRPDPITIIMTGIAGGDGMGGVPLPNLPF